MRKSHSTQTRFDCESIPNGVFNLQYCEEIIPIHFAWQHIYTRPELRDEILQLVIQRVNANSS